LYITEIINSIIEKGNIEWLMVLGDLGDLSDLGDLGDFK